MRATSGLTAVARLELAELLRSRWLVFCGGVYAALLGIFTLVGLNESTVMGFTGVGRVLLSFIHLLVLVLPLLALTATGQVVGQARDEGALEFLLTLPISRRAYLGAVTLVRYLALLGPLLLLMLAMAFIGGVVLRQGVDGRFVGRVIALSASLTWAFVGIGLFISVHVRQQAKAMVSLLLAWVLAVVLLDFALVGMMLAWRLNAGAVFVLAALNPVQCARMALLVTADPDLAVLGPVGFFLATRIGATGLLALGLAWPTLVGTFAWIFAARRFCRADVV